MLATALLLAACGPELAPSEPIFDPAQLGITLAETAPCKHSHEHELRHVRIFADAASRDVFARCALGRGPCVEEGFPEGSLWVKLEYEYEGCKEDELVGYTASVKRDTGSYPAGRDWLWQQVSPSFEVLLEGAPSRCVSCHLDHCGPPHGFDLRCVPD